MPSPMCQSSTLHRRKERRMYISLTSLPTVYLLSVDISRLGFQSGLPPLRYSYSGVLIPPLHERKKRRVDVVSLSAARHSPLSCFLLLSWSNASRIERHLYTATLILRLSNPSISRFTLSEILERKFSSLAMGDEARVSTVT